ncbi:FCD domain-containing protein [Sphingopyxis sp. YR583]|uniref:FCD domain-containing protein n=1 Tax=Sphingopyxis sp. YR583 TaxID=1881047 RepID=UPI0035297BA6
MAAASGNQLFYQIVRSFEQLMALAIPRAWSGRTTHEERDETLALHREVAEAIAERDPARAPRWKAISTIPSAKCCGISSDFIAPVGGQRGYRSIARRPIW